MGSAYIHRERNYRSHKVIQRP